MPEDVAADQCCLRAANVKGLVEAIHAVKSPNKSQVCLSGVWHMSLYMMLSCTHLTTLTAVQLCMLSVNRDGLSLRWEDSSKSLQSSVWLHSEASKAKSVPSAQRPWEILSYALLQSWKNVEAVVLPCSYLLNTAAPGSEGPLD